MDSEGNIVLPIDDLQLETLREGEVVTLPHSASLASLATASRVATVSETAAEKPPDICEVEETPSIGTAGRSAPRDRARTVGGGGSEGGFRGFERILKVDKGFII